MLGLKRPTWAPQTSAPTRKICSDLWSWNPPAPGSCRCQGTPLHQRRSCHPNWARSSAVAPYLPARGVSDRPHLAGPGCELCSGGALAPTPTHWLSNRIQSQPLAVSVWRTGPVPTMTTTLAPRRHGDHASTSPPDVSPLFSGQAPFPFFLFFSTHSCLSPKPRVTDSLPRTA